MKVKMERLVLLPLFSVGCVSDSSVAVAIRRKSKADSIPISNKEGEEECDDESLSSNESNKSSFRSANFSFPKPNISTGIHRLFKGFKTFSHYFVYKDDDDDDIEELEIEMEIGDPTDVKHVTHIGWDGSSTTAEDALMGWQNLINISPDSHSIPWRPSFEKMSMASQEVQPGHFLNGSA